MSILGALIWVMTTVAGAVGTFGFFAWPREADERPPQRLELGAREDPTPRRPVLRLVVAQDSRKG